MSLMTASEAIELHTKMQSELAAAPDIESVLEQAVKALVAGYAYNVEIFASNNGRLCYDPELDCAFLSSNEDVEKAYRLLKDKGFQVSPIRTPFGMENSFFVSLFHENLPR